MFDHSQTDNVISTLFQRHESTVTLTPIYIFTLFFFQRQFNDLFLPAENVQKYHMYSLCTRTKGLKQNYPACCILWSTVNFHEIFPLTTHASLLKYMVIPPVLVHALSLLVVFLTQSPLNHTTVKAGKW